MPLDKKGHKRALILTSLIIFLLLINLLQLLPYTFTPTTQLSINLTLAFPLGVEVEQVSEQVKR